jgi:hypothetical protein
MQAGHADRPLDAARQRSEQYFTSSQFLAHALRHTIGKPQQAQGLTGRSDFLRIFGIFTPYKPQDANDGAGGTGGKAKK